MFFVQRIRNSWKNKNRQPITAAVFSPPAEIYLVSFLTTHRREFSSPIKGTLALHCQVARLVSESFLMLVQIVSNWGADTTKFCVIANNFVPDAHRNMCWRFVGAILGALIKSRCNRADDNGQTPAGENL